MHTLVTAVSESELIARTGIVAAIRGHLIEGIGPAARLGDLCRIERGATLGPLEAEVIGFRDGRTMMMPLGALDGLAMGARIVARGNGSDVPVGRALLGRVVDAAGLPVDGGGDLGITQRRALRSMPPSPMDRSRLMQPLETGVKAIDSMLTLVRGQRVGLFAGSGVGKSSLLGAIAQSSAASVNVVALIGERSREVREFVEDRIGPKAFARTVVVVATSSEPAVVRVKAAYAATAIAEHFRDAGEDVLLLMDSLTRFAMARREIGLAVGEPPTARGYTPSVFAELPQLCERSGPGVGSGAVTGVYTVLVDGDDFNEPLSDAVRGILDGHIVLSREIASAGRYPAIDLLRSVSRLHHAVGKPADLAAARHVLASCALFERNRQLIEIGAYKPGSNAALDRAVALAPRIEAFLAQTAGERVSRANALQQLTQLAAGSGALP